MLFKLKIFCLLLLCAVSLVAGAKPLFTALKTADPLHQTIHYRLNSGFEVMAIEAKLADQVIPFKKNPYPNTTAKTAVLILVDTSDPRRQAILTKISRTIIDLIHQAPPHFQFGLAGFDSEFKLLKPIATNRDDLKTRITSLKAKGQTTELYRNTLKALQVLAQTSAQRKVLWLFSDGIAEDTDYTSNEVVEFALKEDIMLFGFGYPQSISASVYLQNMHRFADQTGGLLIKANTQAILPANSADKLYQQMDNGGQLDFDFSDYTGNTSRLLKVTWSTATIPIEKQWMLTFPKKEQSQPLAPKSDNYTYLLLGLLGLWLLVRFKQRPKELFVYAQLELVASGKQIPVTDTSFTIGRAKDNHFILINDSVSAHHAILHRNRQGNWIISDLDSVNGVYIDNKPINHATLNQGDSFELGEVKLRLQTENMQ